LQHAKIFMPFGVLSLKQFKRRILREFLQVNCPVCLLAKPMHAPPGRTIIRLTLHWRGEA
jgi:hypothetical protein